jgi:hypothetical protein
MTAPASLTTSYQALVNELGFFLFGLLYNGSGGDVISNSQATGNQPALILRAMTKGLQSVYYPGDYVWSFMRPLASVKTLGAYNTGTVIVDASGNVTLNGGTFPSNAASANGQVYINAPQPPAFYSGVWSVGSYTSGTGISLASYTEPMQPYSLASGTGGSISGSTLTWGAATTASVGQYAIIYAAGGGSPTIGAYAISAVNGTTSVTLASPPGDATSVTWSLSAASGVPYNLFFNNYSLPAGFDSFEEDLTETLSGTNRRHTLEKVDEIEIRRRLQHWDGQTRRPELYALTMGSYAPAAANPPATARYITFWPPPGIIHTFNAKATLRPTTLDATNALPLGDEVLAQVLVEACLAAAERDVQQVDASHPDGVHSRLFPSLLATAIAQDRRKASPDTLGIDNGNGRGEYVDRPFRGSRIYLGIGGLNQWIG